MGENVIVAGAGISGLMAAITAAKNGANVTVISEGAGVLSIGSGAIDFLGYVNNKEVAGSPYDSLSYLPDNHPYNIIGKENIKESFDEIISIANDYGYYINTTKSGENYHCISILGTVKPTYICSESMDASILYNARKVLVLGIEFLKDSQPSILIKTLLNNKKFSHLECDVKVVSSPFGKTHRVLTSFDLARYVDMPEGQEWLINTLKSVSTGYDALIIPSICGVDAYGSIYKKIQENNIKVVETIALPPGVGGMRLRGALYSKASQYGVKFILNCKISRAIVENQKCCALVGLHSDIGGDQETIYKADKFIIATGGVIGGGIRANFDKVEEAIFKIPIDAPKSIEDWSSKDFFEDHKFPSFGVTVSKDMHVLDSMGMPVYQNVLFAGNTLGNYDFPAEKSGYGVAIASGYTAGKSIMKI